MTPRLTRRQFLHNTLIGTVAAAGLLPSACRWGQGPTATFIARASDYQDDLAALLAAGLRELGVGQRQIQGRSVLLKPNLVEPHLGAGHINTHPLVVGAAAEVFRRLGAERVMVGEGAGHRRDAHLVLEESRLGEVLLAERIPFVDLNYDDTYAVANAGRRTSLSRLALPVTLRQIDWLVSLPKLKTHHWAGVTLAMKNLFGLLPGALYGWPKNVLHWQGIDDSILDINTTVRTHLAIVDGIVGMEGDGPIMGAPRHAGVLVMGRNPVSVDATCTRIMGIDPARIGHLAAAGHLGPIQEARIRQLGELPSEVRQDFALMPGNPVHQRLRPAEPLSPGQQL